MFSTKCIICYQRVLLKIVIRCLHKNHYEILKLERNCTTKDIKKAFIDLSKTCHPDKNQNVNSHATYVRIVEAYNVLSKARTRADYDLGLRRNIYTDFSSYPNSHNASHERVWRDSSFYENRDKSQDYYNASRPYYGINGVNRVHNGIIAALCIWIAILGAFTQYVVIRTMYNMSFRSIDQKSKENARILSEVREKADFNGNDEQLKQFLIKYKKHTWENNFDDPRN